MNIKKMNPNAIIPTRATLGSAGYDLYAATNVQTTINTGKTVFISAGVALELPSGTVGLIFGRSGLGIKHGITLSNAVGVIDEDYRGEIIVGLTNHSGTAYILAPNERMAQLVIVPALAPQLVEVDELSQTQRGEGGFGSTGKN